MFLFHFNVLTYVLTCVCSYLFAGLCDEAHVLNEKGVLYTAVLGMVDIVRGTNSFFKLQLLKMDKAERYGQD